MIQEVGEPCDGRRNELKSYLQIMVVAVRCAPGDYRSPELGMFRAVGFRVDIEVLISLKCVGRVTSESVRLRICHHSHRTTDEVQRMSRVLR